MDKRDDVLLIEDLRHYAKYIRSRLPAPNVVHAEMLERAANRISNLIKLENSNSIKS